MKVIHGSKQFPKSLKRPVVALGNFDGVHLAHQKMFRWTRKLAKISRGNAVAYTFEPHPVKVLAKPSAPVLLNTLTQKIELLKKQKLAAAVFEKFSSEFAQLSAEDWFEKILVKNLRPAGVVAGYDFTFGSRRSGTVELLEKLCKQQGVQCHILHAQMAGETLISSSNIRQSVAKGDVAAAARLLGRPYFIDGTVIKGAGRGKSLGIPTANLATENELLPLPGVYACLVQLGWRKISAVTNLGMNPTFGGSTLTVETHLLNFKKNIYGKKLRLYFLERLRDERPFQSPAQLVAQIHRDIESAKKLIPKLKF